MIHTLSTSNLSAVFVNKYAEPDEVNWQPFFDYIDDGPNDTMFLQLCSKVYIFDNAVRYSILSWEPIEIVPQARQLFKQQVDAQKELAYLKLPGQGEKHEPITNKQTT